MIWCGYIIGVFDTFAPMLLGGRLVWVLYNLRLRKNYDLMLFAMVFGYNSANKGQIRSLRDEDHKDYISICLAMYVC